MNKQNTYAKKATTLAIGVYFLLGVNCYAYEGWNLQLEPMYMGVAGTNKHQSTTVTTTTTNTPSPPPYGSYTSNTTSSSTSTSQNIDMGGNGTLRGQLEYMPKDWGVGVSGWWFDTSGSTSQNINSPATTNTSVSYFSNNFSISAPPSGSESVLTTSANSSLSVWNVDAYGIKTLGEFQNGRINMTLGAKFGSIDSKVSEAINQSPTTITTTNGYSYSQNGAATISANASFLVGPSIGVQSFGKYGRNRIEGFLSQSVLIGNVDRQGSRQNTYSYPSSYSAFTYSSNQNANFSNSETAVIPVTEMKIKYLYDVTENLSLGLGFFGSAWVNTPAITTMQQNKTLFFYGGLASINLRY
jgi:hypothetical protein